MAESKGEAKGFDDQPGEKQSKGGDLDEKGGTPPTPADLEFLRDGYNQTYVIKKDDAGNGSFQRELLFRCGNWCYVGRVDLGFPELSLNNIPAVVPHLQRQQGGLRYLCEAKLLSNDEPLAAPLKQFYSDISRIADLIGDDSVSADIEQWSSTFEWMADDNAKTYFELKTGNLDMLKCVDAICSKTYNRGLILVTIYFEGSFYVTVQDGEGTQPLLDVQFPDVSQRGQGFHVRSFAEADEGRSHWQKLTLWQVLESAKEESGRGGAGSSAAAASKPKVVSKQAFKDARGQGYVQSYCVMRQSAGAPVDGPREVLFRFGNWCYAGRVRLSQAVSLGYLRRLIPELRMQQSSLEFVYDVGAIPAHSPYVGPMTMLARAATAMAGELSETAGVLERLIEKSAATTGGAAAMDWVDQPGQAFFEFATAGDVDGVFADVELMASKVYTCGVIMVIIYYQDTYYAMLQEGGSELPLLDSLFPDVSVRGKGYQIQTYPRGVEDWEALRKLSLWQASAADVAARAATAAAMPKDGVAAEEAADDDSKQQPAGDREEGSKGGGGAKDSAEKVTSINPSKPRLAPAKVSMPHHLPPMKSGGGGLGGLEGASKLSPMSASGGGPAPWERGSALGSAPWDASGRPKGLAALGAKEK